MQPATRTNRHRLLAISFLLVACLSLHAQTDSISEGAGGRLLQQSEETLKARLKNWFASYQASDIDKRVTLALDKVDFDHEAHTITIRPKESFGWLPFTPWRVSGIYKEVERLLPPTLHNYQLSIRQGAYDIRQLTPGWQSKEVAEDRLLSGSYKGRPWVQNLSHPIQATHGLYNRHLTLWASHGRFFDTEKQLWRWQRPYLFCTTEDLLTQTIVVPYLIPMLEGAGATVFTPRERAWQREEVIVDNDLTSSSSYQEWGYGSEWETCPRGWAGHEGMYLDFDNPFETGTSRITHTTTQAKQAIHASWVPTIRKTGNYAVYVTYQSLPESLDKVVYTVVHSGIETSVAVNQQMGGGTWVYLGTFRFKAHDEAHNYVLLSNQQEGKGVICADAIRFGGGMGNVGRQTLESDSLPIISGLPRYLEGARYTAQWYGMPYEVYSTKAGANDYGDDINARSMMENYLSGGSIFNPDTTGLHVPMELSLAFHSDAGYKADGIVGSLSICTTDFQEGLLGNKKTHRLLSRDLADRLLTDLCRDMKQTYGQWSRRYIYDRNYSETRLPAVPSAILEMFSHQNFEDMKRAHDPNVKFTIARAIYKSILRHLAQQHHETPVVAPLPVHALKTTLNPKNGVATLTWHPVQDTLEVSAKPTGYIVYTCQEARQKPDSVNRGWEGEFDNGMLVKGQTHWKMNLKPGVLTSFRVTAVNQGGESLPSEVVSVLWNPEAEGTILVVNGFSRLSSPQVIDTPDRKGFDLDEDLGVCYGKTPGFSGRQMVFDATQGGKEGETALGYSGQELEGTLVAGNTFDYTPLHARAIQASGHWNIVSCHTQNLEEEEVNLKDYAATDLYFGAQRNDGYSSVAYPTLTHQTCNLLTNYLQQGGRLLMSGAYVARDLNTRPEGKYFLEKTLLCSPNGSLPADSLQALSGMGTRLQFARTPDAPMFAIRRPDVIHPQGDAFSILSYDCSNHPAAAIARKGQHPEEGRHIFLAFPFETITSRPTQFNLMAGFLQFLLK